MHKAKKCKPRNLNPFFKNITEALNIKQSLLVLNGYPSWSNGSAASGWSLFESFEKYKWFVNKCLMRQITPIGSGRVGWQVPLASLTMVEIPWENSQYPSVEYLFGCMLNITLKYSWQSCISLQCHCNSVTAPPVAFQSCCIEKIEVSICGAWVRPCACPFMRIFAVGHMQPKSRSIIPCRNWFRRVIFVWLSSSPVNVHVWQFGCCLHLAMLCELERGKCSRAAVIGRCHAANMNGHRDPRATSASVSLLFAGNWLSF